MRAPFGPVLSPSLFSLPPPGGSLPPPGGLDRLRAFSLPFLVCWGGWGFMCCLQSPIRSRGRLPVGLGSLNKIPVPPFSLSHGQPLADDVPMAQSCNKLPTASTSALLGWLGAKLVHSSPCLSRSVAHGARAPQPAWREKVGFIEKTAWRQRRSG